MQADRLQEALAVLSVTQLWELSGLPCVPAKQCHSPFRKDKTKSFSVYWNEAQDKECWKDFVTGEHGDAADFYAKWKGIDRRRAVPLFIEMALGQNFQFPHNSYRKPARKNAKRIITDPAMAFVATPEKLKDCFKGELVLPTREQRIALCDQRGYTEAGVKLMVKRGVLRVTKYGGEDYYVITDERRVCADHRPLSGKPFPNGCKTKSLYGWKRQWPLGIDAHFEPGELGEEGIEGIIFSEGGPNLLAGYDLICRARLSANHIAVSMPGVGSKIPSEILSFFKGKRVFFIPDSDTKNGRQAGIEAMEGWIKRIRLNAVLEAWDTLRLDKLAWSTKAGDSVTDTNEILYAGSPCIAQTITWLREGRSPLPNCD